MLEQEQAVEPDEIRLTFELWNTSKHVENDCHMRRFFRLAQALAFMAEVPTMKIFARYYPKGRTDVSTTRRSTWSRARGGFFEYGHCLGNHRIHLDEVALARARASTRLHFDVKIKVLDVGGVNNDMIDCRPVLQEHAVGVGAL